MATINLTGVWHQEVQRITNQYTAGRDMPPEAVVPITNLPEAISTGARGSQLSPPPGNLKLPQAGVAQG